MPDPVMFGVGSTLVLGLRLGPVLILRLIVRWDWRRGSAAALAVLTLAP